MTDRRRELAWADANPFVSLIIGPGHSTHDPALILFRAIAEGGLRLIVTPVTVHEIVNVLESHYRLPRGLIAEELSGILRADGLAVVEQAVLEEAMDLYGRHRGLDFAEAYLAASAVVIGPPNVASFDRDLDRLEGIRRIAS